MPLTELHKKKLKKNLTVAGIVILWCALIWAVTMIRIAQADPFEPGRIAHLEKVTNTKEQWEERYGEKAETRLEKEEKSELRRTERLNQSFNTKEQWDNRYLEKADNRLERESASDERRTAHENRTAVAPEAWWETWIKHQQAREP